MSFVDRGDDLLDCHVAEAFRSFFGKLSDIREGLGYIPAAALRIGNNAGDRTAVTQNDDRCAVLNLVEQLREMGFCHRGLDLAQIMLLPGFAAGKGGSVLVKTAMILV